MEQKKNKTEPKSTAGARPDVPTERKDVPPTGRTEIDWCMIEKLGQRMISVTDIVAIIAVSESTLRRACIRDQGVPLAEYIERQRAKGRAKIHKVQFSRVLKGLSDRQLTLLATNYCGQTTNKTEITGPDGGPIQAQPSIDMSKLSESALREIIAAGTLTEPDAEPDADMP